MSCQSEYYNLFACRLFISLLIKCLWSAIKQLQELNLLASMRWFQVYIWLLNTPKHRLQRRSSFWHLKRYKQSNTCLFFFLLKQISAIKDRYVYYTIYCITGMRSLYEAFIMDLITNINHLWKRQASKHHQHVLTWEMWLDSWLVCLPFVSRHWTFVSFGGVVSEESRFYFSVACFSKSPSLIFHRLQLGLWRGTKSSSIRCGDAASLWWRCGNDMDACRIKQIPQTDFKTCWKNAL